MIADGDKGAVIQRDQKTYAISPHLPCGLVTPAQLRKLADAAEKYKVAAIKITCAERIALVGVKEDDVDKIWADLGEKPGHLVGQVVRSVKACPGIAFCKKGRQNSLKLGLEFDKKYHGRKLPGKMKFGISGCGNQCAESSVKDIGLIGGTQGWHIVIGGCVGTCPKIGKDLTDDELTDEQAVQVVDRLVNYFEATANPGERMGEMIQRIGLGTIKKAVGLMD